MPKLKPLFKMYQEVVLVRESLKDNFFGEPVVVRKGQQGVIVHIHIVSGVPHVGYEVEFFDKNDETVAVSTVEENDIAALPGGHPDVKAVNSKKHKPKKHAA